MKFLIATFVAFMPALGFAHSGHESIVMSAATVSNSLAAGMLHPLFGLDHLLSLIAVGILAARLKSKQRILIPLGFIGLMLVGFFTAHAGIHMVSTGAIETLIAISLTAAAVFVVAGNVMQFNHSVNVMAAWGITAFASVHGMAHGLEVPAGASAQVFALGFALACFLVTLVTTLSLGLLTKINTGLDKQKSIL